MAGDRAVEREAEHGIDVGYVRQVKAKARHPLRSSQPPSAPWADCRVFGRRPARAPSRCTTKWPRFLVDSGYDKPSHARVITDGALDLKKVSAALPHAGRWVLDWAHIGRMLRHLNQAVAPFAYGRLTPAGSAFEMWDRFVRFRSNVWTGQKRRWRRDGDTLYRLMEIIYQRSDEHGSRLPARHAPSS